MLRQKLKLSLVEDYIKVVGLSSFCSNCLKNSGQEYINSLSGIKILVDEIQKAYDKLLFKYNIMDVSLLVLKKELKENSSLQNAKSFDSVNSIENIEKCKKSVKDIYVSLQQKLNKLSLSDIEKKYITKDIIAFFKS